MWFISLVPLTGQNWILTIEGKFTADANTLKSSITLILVSVIVPAACDSLCDRTDYLKPLREW